MTDEELAASAAKIQTWSDDELLSSSRAADRDMEQARLDPHGDEPYAYDYSMCLYMECRRRGL